MSQFVEGNIIHILLHIIHTLQFTYVFGFYLEESKEKELFEFLQEDLEKSTEYLSEVMFREIDNISLPIADPEDILLIKNSTKVTRKVQIITTPLPSKPPFTKHAIHCPTFLAVLNNYYL